MSNDMSDWRSVFLLGGIFLWGGSLWGQDFLNKPIDNKASPPAPPLIQQSGAVAYTAAFTYFPGGADPNAGPQIKELTVEKYGDLRHDVRQWEGAPSTETWFDGLVSLEKGTDAFGTPNGIHGSQLYHPVDSFPELAWVNKGNFAGVIREGKTIDVFRLEGMTLSFGPFQFRNEEVFIYVDEETRLPLALKTAHYAVSYTYGEVPTHLELPDEYLRVYQADQAKIEHPPLPP